MKNLVHIATLILTLSVLALSSVAMSASLPDPPSGFSWYKASNGVGTFLRPAGWHVKEEAKGGTNALFISREKIEKMGRFSVGLSVNQFTNHSASSPIPPSKYAERLIRRMVSRHEVLKSGIVKGGSTDMHVARIVGNNNNKKTIVHYIAIGMDDRDEVYLVFFEAPEEEWETLYSTTGAILNFFFLGS